MMQIASGREFAAITFRESTIFDTVIFAETHKKRADDVVFIILGDSKTRFGLIAGIQGSRLKAPFSAPWAMPLLGKHRPRIVDFQNAALDLCSGMRNLNFTGIDLVLPPTHVAPDHVAKWTIALMRAGFTPKTPDVSFHLALADWEQRLDPKARPKLAVAQKQDVRFLHTDNDVGRSVVFEVIRSSRELRGIPLHMSLGDIETMRSLVPVDFFFLEHSGVPVASAVCYQLTNEIAYVVYWGHLVETGVAHLMNLLASELCSYYRQRGFAVLDTGSASINGEPQYGLADFKQSLGGIASMKSRFSFP